MKTRKIVAILLCLVMLVALAACGGNGTTNNSSNPPTDNSSTPPSGTSPSPSDPGDNTPSDKTKDNLNISIASDSGTLNPTQMTLGLMDAVQTIYEPLWEVNEVTGDIIWLLAESVEEVSPTQWTVKLREGVTFSNGNAFTADDVIHSLKYWKGVGVNAVRVQSLDAENTKKIDDYTVELHMVDYYVMNWSACSLFMIFDEESFDEVALTLNPIGTGPYKVKEYVTSSHLTLEANDTYWGEQPAIRQLSFKVMAEPSQIVNGLSTGMIDVASELALADYDYVSSLSGYRVDARLFGGGKTLSFNAGKLGEFNLIDDPENGKLKRYAVIHAIDPQVIVDIVYEGRGATMNSLATTRFLDFQPEYANMHSTYSEGYNVELAQRYADESGLTGKTITIMTDGMSDRVKTAEIIQDMLSKIGVTAEIVNYDPATVNTMQYDPEATFDLRVANQIAPNMRTCDLLVNGVRYSPVLSAPGAFPDNQYYLEIAPLTIHTSDETRRLEYVWEVLSMYVENAVSYMMCEVELVQVFAEDIDANSVVRGVCNGNIRYSNLKVVS